MTRPGQPTLLTPQVLDDVRRLLPTVLYLETVADYIGVSRMTLRNWLHWGRTESRRLASNKRARPLASEKPYLEFFYAVQKSLAEGELYATGTIKKAAAEQWQAAAWLMERRYPARWGRKDRTEAEQRGNTSVVVLKVVEVLVPRPGQAPPLLLDVKEEVVKRGQSEASGNGTGTNGAPP